MMIPNRDKEREKLLKMAEEEKLKTLNEIIVLCDKCKEDYNYDCHHPCCRNNKRARKEGIKWINDLNKKIEGIIDEMILMKKNKDFELIQPALIIITSYEGQARILREFFNVTKEEK